MFGFFKLPHAVREFPYLQIGELGLIGYLGFQKLLAVQQEKEALALANPGKPLVIKPFPGYFGFSRWKWVVEETKEETSTAATPSNK